MSILSRPVDQGIEILTGMEAGERLENGKFKEGSVNDLVDKKLRELGTKIKEFEGGGEEGAKEEKKRREKGKHNPGYSKANQVIKKILNAYLFNPLK